MNRAIAIALTTLAALTVTACAGSSIGIGIGGGSFGGRGGVGGSVSTTVPIEGRQKDQEVLPILQVWLPDAVIASVYPDKAIPFTAEKKDVEALANYSQSDAEPALSDTVKDQLDQCLAEEAQCRIRLAEPAGETDEQG